MDARTGKHVEGAGEFVLMNVRRAIQPEENLNVEPRVFVDDQFRLAEPGLGLSRLLVIQQKIPHQVRQINVFSGRPLLQSGSSDLRKLREREVLRFPPTKYRFPEFA